MFDLAMLLDDCRTALKEKSPEAVVHEILSAVVADAAGIEAALGKARPGNGDCAEYLLLHASDEFTVLRATLPGRLRGPPHNHLVWAVIGIYRGVESNVFYLRDGPGLVEIGARQLAAPGVMTLPAEVIHRIENPMDEASCALHVYGGALANPARSLWNPFTLREEPFRTADLAAYEREMSRRSMRGR